MSKSQRIKAIIIGFTSIAIGISIILYNFSNNIIFFYSPTELKASNDTTHKVIRIGGLVKQSSIIKSNLKTKFILTDLKNEIPVVYSGILPNLFRENQGMVAKGKFENNIFNASELLAKHDENYMPKEVADSLKKSGLWKQESK